MLLFFGFLSHYVLSFDTVFGFVLVFGENVSIYTHVLSTCSSLMPLCKPSKYMF